MKAMIKFLLMSILLVPVIGMAQQSGNVFLDRNFWNEKPSIDEIKKKIAEGNDPMEMAANHFNATAFAILTDNPASTIEFLLTIAGNDSNILTHEDRTYLHWAAIRGNVDVMKMLIEKGAKVNLTDQHGYSVLNIAATNGVQDPAIYDYLLAHGAQITDTNRAGATPLLLLVPHLKDMTMVDYFTKKGLDLKAKDNDGNGAFFYAARSGNITMMNLLISKKLEYKGVNNLGENAMLVAAVGPRRGTNTLEVFKYLESKGIKVNVTSNEGLTPLIAIAASTKDPEIINYFIQKGISPNQADKEGTTALMKAAERNDLIIVTALADKTRDIDAKNAKGQTALMLAVKGNSAEVVSLLLGKGAAIDAQDNDGNAIGYYLVDSYQSAGGRGGFGGGRPGGGPGGQGGPDGGRPSDPFTSKLEVLKNAGLDVQAPQAQGKSLLYLAAEKNDFRLIKIVIGLGVDVNKADENGTTPLQVAAMKAQDDKILKFLISNGADKSVKTAFDETAYDLAGENEALKGAGVDIQFLR